MTGKIFLNWYFYVHTKKTIVLRAESVKRPINPREFLCGNLRVIIREIYQSILGLHTCSNYILILESCVLIYVCPTKPYYSLHPVWRSFPLSIRIRFRDICVNIPGHFPTEEDDAGPAYVVSVQHQLHREGKTVNKIIHVQQIYFCLLLITILTTK